MDDKKEHVTIRLGKRELAALGALALVAFYPGALSTEQITMTTYYPSPYGVYDQMRSQNNTFLSYNSGAVGIGTTNPAANTKLHVAGGGNRTQIDGQLGVGGGYTDIYGTGISVTGRNIHVQGNEAATSGWLRLGDAWGFNGMYSENGDLILGAASSRVRIGPDQSQYIAQACRNVTYNFGVAAGTPCPSGWSVTRLADTGPGLGYLYVDFAPPAAPVRVYLYTNGSGQVLSRRTDTNALVASRNIIVTDTPISGQMTCCKLQQY